jgi:hypothetical protein
MPIDITDGEPGTTGNPLFRFVVAGVDHSLVANRVMLTSWTVFLKGGWPELSWIVAGSGALPTLPDPYLGKLIELYTDEGPEVLRFRGRCVEMSPPAFDDRLGWVRSYSAYGLAWDANRIPVINPTDLSDAILYNERRGSYSYAAERAGRSIGWICRHALEAREIALALNAKGVGGYATIPTTPAVAHATVSSGVVTVVVDSGGAGYSSGSAPRAVLVGGGGTYTSCSVTVSVGGAVTAVSVTGSTGYTSPPEVWISPLALTTLQDLAALDFSPPWPVAIAGERVLLAIEGAMRGAAPNHVLHVEPSGTIRFRDLRTFTSTVLTMNSATAPVVDVAGVQLGRSIEGRFPRVVVRGGPAVAASRLTTAAGTLVEDFAHDGLDNTAAKTDYRLRHFTNPSDAGIAKFTATVGSGAVSTLTNTFKGFGYAASTTYDLRITGGGGSSATATFTTNSAGQYTSHSITAGGTGYTSAPTVTAPAPPGTPADSGSCSCPSAIEVTVTSADTKRTWAANFWDQTSSGVLGTIFLTDSSASGVDVCFSAQVISHAALTAGGTCTLTLDREMPSTSFDSYALVGTAAAGSHVYRRYKPDDAGQAASLIGWFPFAVSYSTAGGASAELTSFPVASVSKSSQRATVPVRVNPDAGYFMLDRPSVTFFGVTMGPDDTVPSGNQPDDVEILAAIVTGSMEAIQPPDVTGNPDYAGTSNTVEGLEETLIVPLPSWVDPGQKAIMLDFASEVLDAVKDSLVEGTIPLLGFYSDFFDFGKAVTIEGVSFATPWEDEDLPIVGVDVAFGTGTPRHRMALRVSNAREAISSAAFQRPLPTGMSMGGDLANAFGAVLSTAQTWGGFAGAIGGAPTSNTAYTNTANPWMRMAQAGRSSWLGNAARGAANWLGNAAAGARAWLTPHVQNRQAMGSGEGRRDVNRMKKVGPPNPFKDDGLDAWERRRRMFE